MREISRIDSSSVLTGIHIGDSGFQCVCGCGETGVVRRVDGEDGIERIVEVVEFDVIAVKTFYVKQTAVEEFELFSWVVGSL